MSCMILSAQELTMTTTQFTRAVCHESCVAEKEYLVPQPRPLRMNWVVVTDDKGNRRLQIDWHADRAD